MKNIWRDRERARTVLRALFCLCVAALAGVAATLAGFDQPYVALSVAGGFVITESVTASKWRIR
jgi:hypothetical protein